MSVNCWGAYDLTGGTTGTLDNIDGDYLSAGDIALVITSLKTYFYEVRNSGDAESSPNIIAPDSNAGTLRWHRIDAYDQYGIADLGDPNADRIVFWDDTASSFAYLVPNTGVSITGTNLNVTADYSVITANDAATDVTAAELEILTDGTYTDLHGHDYFTIMQANGWEDASSLTLSWNNGAEQLTVTPASTSYYWIGGVRYSINAAKSIILDGTSGSHFIYIDSSGVLQELVNPSHNEIDNAIENKCLVAWVYWNDTDSDTYILARETHGVVMSPATHHWIHDNIGARYKEGFALSGYTLNNSADADVAFDLTDGEFYDEDIEHQISDGIATNQYEQVLTGDAEVPVLYKDDVDGTWTQQAASTLPYILQGGDTYISYNNDDGDGTWSLVELGNQKFMLQFLVATNDWEYPIKMVAGSAEYNTAAGAEAAIGTEVVNWATMPAAEFTLLYVFVLKASNGGTKNVQIADIIDYRLAQVSGASYTPTDHGTLSGLSDDDHTQYVDVLGSRDIVQAPAGAWSVTDTDGDIQAVFTSNGAIELYHDNFKRLTTSTVGDGGIVIWDDDGTSNTEIYHGSGTDDLVIDHNVSGGDIYIRPQSAIGGQENGIIIKSDGAVELYFDNSLKLATTTGGAALTGYLDVSGGAEFGSSITLENQGAGNEGGEIIFESQTGGVAGTAWYLDTSSGNLRTFAGGKLTSSHWYNAGSPYISLYHNNSIVFSTSANGYTVDGSTYTTTVYRNDSGTNRMTIQCWTDDHVYFTNETSTGKGFIFRADNGAGGNDVIWAGYAGGSMTMYYDGSVRLATSAGGISVTGAAVISGNLNLGGTVVDHVYDEDDMASDDVNGLCTQQSIKAYVDDSISGGGWTYGSQTSTSGGGTTVNLSSSLAGATQIIVMLNGVSTSTASQPPIVQIAKAAGWVTSGYIDGINVDTSGGGGAQNKTDGWWSMLASQFAAADAVYGIFKLTCWDAAEGIWYCTHHCTDGGSWYDHPGGGWINLGGTITSLRLTTTGGAATFDAGEARVMYM